DAGLTPAVEKEVGASLDAHGLIKVRVLGDDREARIQIYETLCANLKAEPIQHIGKLLVLYRPQKEAVKEKTARRGGGMREVTIVKSNPTKRPTVTKVMVKGNERVTQGGNIRKAKTRQVSRKKQALSSGGK
ncbi:MAG: YhbY family RNA-binding protein, partial [Lacisediminimonas sp.]|nr:YhbY family RNA-binding protein [Lacisediminimonas sp.]